VSPRPVHEQVLEAASRVAGRDRTFRMRDVVTALPHLNPGTVRTHIASRCCVNCAAHHHTRWRYFRSLGAGMYRLETATTTRSTRGRRAIPSQDRIIAAAADSVDPTLITSNLRLTPTERLERMRAFVKFIETARAENTERLRRPVRSTR
jgi:hypothetical protein